MHGIFARVSTLLMVLGMSVWGQPAQSVTALQRFLENYLTPPVLAPSDDQRYEAVFVDLKDDGKHEVLVYLKDASWCGSGGCTTLVLAPNGSVFEIVTKITVTRLPIRVLATKTNGWHDLSVLVAGGGVPAHEAKLVFDGKSYPSNPSTRPAVELQGKVEGRVILSGNESALDAGQSAVEDVLHTQQDAWNHHDLDAFMAGYWNSADLTFFSGAKQTSGWQATLDRYKATYASPGHEMGTLEFSGLRVEMLGPESAFVRGAWHLTMSDGKTPHGLFTLVFRKFPDGWKIIHDHTSAAD